ncbi:alpha-2,8-sialyltransferase 8B-like [Branchiostoma floridae]|uniref:Alpha-2,8-sialyltransferase 8B-like n=1 Tax=Branchiostoma floridae TaxID=7739 RepID=A0A9J7LBE5_BRAFL|nr:alpha-2,8-sialyltransferase 8B-like [Branchiostoma floridae]
MTAPFVGWRKTMFGRRLLRSLFYAILLFGISLIGLGLVFAYNHTRTWRLDSLQVLREYHGVVTVRRQGLNLTRHELSLTYDINQTVTKEWHFNMTNVMRIRNITQKYFDPKRHVIYYSDYNVLMRKCQPQYFTLLKDRSRRMPCNIVRTPIKHYRTCAVVGNGGILLDSGCGAEIDAHEFVIRSNLPPVSPYRTDVGSRTDLTTVNEKVLSQVYRDLLSKNATLKKAMLDRLGETPGMVLSYTLYFIRSKAAKKMKSIDKVIQKNKLTAVVAFPYKSFLRSKGVYQELVGEEWNFASTGLNTFALASTFCDKISMYGFYPMSTYQNKAVPYHYYDSRIPSARHEFDNEFKLLRNFHAQGIIRHVIGKCNID